MSSMPPKDSEQPNTPESRPSSSPYTAVLFTALVALIFGILIAHSVMVANIADTPKVVAQALNTLHADLSYLRSINSELGSLNNGLRTALPSTVTVTPALFATFTVTAR